jgi:hypothetical protein
MSTRMTSPMDPSAHDWHRVRNDDGLDWECLRCGATTPDHSLAQLPGTKCPGDDGTRAGGWRNEPTRQAITVLLNDTTVYSLGCNFAVDVADVFAEIRARLDYLPRWSMRFVDWWSIENVIRYELRNELGPTGARRGGTMRAEDFARLARAARVKAG